jgi:hypothetical protein
MKFYKLELINREQSYNQMFGTTPMLGGVAQPMGVGKPPVLAKQSTKNMNQLQSKKILS